MANSIVNSHFPEREVHTYIQNILYRLPLPLPLPRPLPMAVGSFGTAAFFLGVSSTSNASKFKLSGRSQALMVEPLTDSVE